MKKRELLILLLINFLLINSVFGQMGYSDLKKSLQSNFNFHYITMKPKSSLKFKEDNFVKEVYLDEFSKDSIENIKLDQDTKIRSFLNIKIQDILIITKNRSIFFKVLRFNNLKLTFIGADLQNKKEKFYFFCKADNYMHYVIVSYNKNNLFFNVFDIIPNYPAVQSLP